MLKCLHLPSLNRDSRRFDIPGHLEEVKAILGSALSTHVVDMDHLSGQLRRFVFGVQGKVSNGGERLLVLGLRFI